MLIYNNYISEDILNILDDLKKEVPDKLSTYKISGTGIAVTCPVHANGQEKNPSCFINNTKESIEQGTFHCFTCGASGSFSKFVGECFDKSESYGARWLINRYATGLSAPKFDLPIIDLSADKVEESPKIDLSEFESYHPYMTQRGISNEIISKFNLKYDSKTGCIVFPVYDEKGKLSFLTRRSVEGKKFIIDKGASKSIVYGLDKAIEYKEVYVVESQINCLVLWSWGIPSIALLGAGTTYDQVKKLSNTPIRSFVLCYDGDEAGHKGAGRFKKFISRDKFISVINMPSGTDVADYTKEQFNELIKTSLQSNNISL